MFDWIPIAEARGRGLVFSLHLRELGVSRGDVLHALRAGALYRVRHGVLARPPGGSPWLATERYRNLVRATGALMRPDRVLSHRAAAVIHGLPMIGALPVRVDAVAQHAGSGHSSPGIIEHRTRVQPTVELIDGLLVTGIDRTLVDIASTSTLLVATVVIDAALREHRTDHSRLRDELERVAPRYGHSKARLAIDFGDGLSANAGESLSRVRMWQLGFTAPELQVHVSTSDGDYDVDFGWRSSAVFGEFDGIQKYVREEFAAGESAAQVVIREKRREDSIRRTTRRAFARWGWADAWSPSRLEQILSEAGVPRTRAR